MQSGSIPALKAAGYDVLLLDMKTPPSNYIDTAGDSLRQRLRCKPSSQVYLFDLISTHHTKYQVTTFLPRHPGGSKIVRCLDFRINARVLE